MFARPLAILCCLAATSAFGARPQKGVVTYKQAKHLSDGRPSVTRAAINPKSDDFSLNVDFDKPATAADCKSKCGRATFLIDTDADTSTGLQQGPGKPPTGADLAVYVEGFDDLGAVKPEPYVRVVVRQFSDEDRTLEDGDVVQQLDSRKDKDRLTVKGNSVSARLDASSTTIPAAKTCRFVYLAPSAKPLVTQCTGITRSAGGGEVSIHRGSPSYGSSSGSARRTRKTGGNGDVPPSVRPGEVEVKSGGSAYDPKKVDSRWGEGG